MCRKFPTNRMLGDVPDSQNGTIFCQLECCLDILTNYGFGVIKQNFSFHFSRSSSYRDNCKREKWPGMMDKQSEFPIKGVNGNQAFEYMSVKKLLLAGSASDCVYQVISFRGFFLPGNLRKRIHKCTPGPSSPNRRKVKTLKFSRQNVYSIGFQIDW